MTTSIAANVNVRSASSAEIEQAVSTVVAAFIADPVVRTFFPESHTYLTYFPPLVRAYARPSSEQGSLYAVGSIAGAALWMPPGAHPDEETLIDVMETAIPESRREHLFGVFAQMGASHPQETHWYLPLIGVDPAHRGKGYGTSMLAHALATCDKQQCLAYLESTNPNNTRLYARFGFEPVGSIPVADGVVLTPMVRKSA